MEVISSLWGWPSHKSSASGRKVTGKGSTNGKGQHKSVNGNRDPFQREDVSGNHTLQFWATTTNSAQQATFETLDVSSVLCDATRPSYYIHHDGQEWIKFNYGAGAATAALLVELSC